MPQFHPCRIWNGGGGGMTKPEGCNYSKPLQRMTYHNSTCLHGSVCVIAIMCVFTCYMSLNVE